MYDLKIIKSIPCKDVASRLGIGLKQVENKLWGKLRPFERTASFSINEDKNVWYDFGLGKGGSNIDLVMEKQGLSKEDAIKWIAEEFGIEHEKFSSNRWRPLTDSQYRKLGIQPERATMNFAFDLNKHSIQQLERWSEKYGMPVSKLAEKYPTIYNKMIDKFSMKKINFLRDAYYTNVTMYKDPTMNDITREFLKHTATQYAQDLAKTIELYQRALTTSKDYSNLKVNIEKDFSNEQKQNNNSQGVPQLTEDEKIRERIVNVYKNAFNYEYVKYFSNEQAKALKDFNMQVTKDNRKFMPIDSIKKAYVVLGENMQKLEDEYSLAQKNGSSNIEKIKAELNKVKDMFNTCNKIIDGIREANLTAKNEMSKQLNPDRSIETSHDMTL